MKSFAVTGAVSLLICIGGCSEQTKLETEEAVQQSAEAAASAMQDAKNAAEKTADTVSEAAGTAMDKAKSGGELAKEKVQQGMSSLVDRARTTVSNLEGGPEMLKRVTEFFASARESLGSIKDSETAKAAAAKLSELSGSLDELSASMKDLPAEAKSAVVRVVETGTAALKTIVEKVMAMPEVQEAKDVIQPKIDEIMEKLASMTK